MRDRYFVSNDLMQEISVSDAPTDWIEEAITDPPRPGPGADYSPEEFIDRCRIELIIRKNGWRAP
jgi:hypothetical protein